MLTSNGVNKENGGSPVSCYGYCKYVDEVNPTVEGNKIFFLVVNHVSIFSDIIAIPISNVNAHPYALRRLLLRSRRLLSGSRQKLLHPPPSRKKRSLSDRNVGDRKFFLHTIVFRLLYC